MVSVCKTFLPLLKKTEGRIVNVASISGRLASPGAAAYCISKSGVEAFSDSLRNEMRHFRVIVHIVEPGMFKTNITGAEKNRRCLQQLWENLDMDTRECYGVEFYEQGMVTLSDILFVKPSLILPLSTPQRKGLIFLQIISGNEGSSHITKNRNFKGLGYKQKKNLQWRINSKPSPCNKMQGSNQGELKVGTLLHSPPSPSPLLTNRKRKNSQLALKKEPL